MKTPTQPLSKVAAKLPKQPEKSAKVATQKAFSVADLARLELLQLRANNAVQQNTIAESAAQKFVADANVIIKQHAEAIATAKKAAAEKVEDLHTLYAELEKSYDISMKNIRYDPVSGQIAQQNAT